MPESIVRAIVESAELSAELLGNFLQGISRHLQRCNCETSVQVDDFLYRRLEVVAAVLAELRISAPGPTHLKRLLLQLVIDPREPVTTELQRFRFVRQESRLRLIQHERDQYSTPAIEVEYECYDLLAVAIHNALEDGPAALWSLRGLIEETCPKIHFVADASMPGAVVPNDVRAFREGIEVNVERRVVTIAGETYAVTEEGANLLSVLIDMGCGEWYSGSEIKAHDRGDLCGRIDRTRKALPPEVQRWIETSRNGFRLGRPPRSSAALRF